MKIIITKLYINSESKDGKAFINKSGEAYKKIAIQCKEYGDKYLSGFVNRTNEMWKIGDEVDIIVEERGQDSNGNPYLNFKSLGRLDLLEQRIKKLEDR